MLFYVFVFLYLLEFPFSGLTEVVACSLLVPSAMKSLWYLVLEFYESQR